MKKIKSQRGNSLVEFAAVLPFLLLLILGIVEFSIMFYDKAIITHASREGARYGTVLHSPTYPTEAQITTYTQSICQDYLISFGSGENDVDVIVNQSSATPSSGDQLTITVEFTYVDLALSKFFSGSNTTTLSSTSVMIYE